jgi:hypothetical protein
VSFLCVSSLETFNVGGKEVSSANSCRFIERASWNSVQSDLEDRTVSVETESDYDYCTKIESEKQKVRNAIRVSGRLLKATVVLLVSYPRQTNTKDISLNAGYGVHAPASEKSGTERFERFFRI